MLRHIEQWILRKLISLLISRVGSHLQYTRLMEYTRACLQEHYTEDNTANRYWYMRDALDKAFPDYHLKNRIEQDDPVADIKLSLQADSGGGFVGRKSRERLGGLVLREGPQRASNVTDDWCRIIEYARDEAAVCTTLHLGGTTVTVERFFGVAFCHDFTNVGALQNLAEKVASVCDVVDNFCGDIAAITEDEAEMERRKVAYVHAKSNAVVALYRLGEGMDGTEEGKFHHGSTVSDRIHQAVAAKLLAAQPG